MSPLLTLLRLTYPPHRFGWSLEYSRCDTCRLAGLFWACTLLGWPPANRGPALTLSLRRPGWYVARSDN